MKRKWNYIAKILRSHIAPAANEGLFLLSFRDNNNAYSETKIAAVFDLYKDPHEDLILAEGIEKLCKDLEVKPEDFKVLVLGKDWSH